MKPLHLILATIIAFVLVNLSAKAQFSLHVGGAMPLHDFASSINKDMSIEENIHAISTSADLGINAGIKYNIPVFLGFKLFGAVDINYNPFKKDAKNNIEETVGSLVDIKYSKYFNAPISGGLEYAHNISNYTSVFVNAGIVFNHLKITNFKMENKTLNIKNTLKSEIANGVGFKIGGGIWFADKLSVQIAYFDMGKHKLTKKFITEGESIITQIKEEINSESNLGLFTFGIGLRL